MRHKYNKRKEAFVKSKRPPKRRMKEEKDKNVFKRRKFIKNVEAENDPQNALDIKKESDDAAKEAMKCPNCSITFVNVATFQAHVNFYCKKRASEQD